MLKHIKHLLAHSSLYIAIAITMVIAYLSLANIGSASINFTHFDKIKHFIAYFALTFFWLLACKENKKLKLLVIVLCVFYGIVIEVLQVTLTSYRYAEYLDILANSTGTVVALLMFNYFKKNQSI